MPVLLAILILLFGSPALAEQAEPLPLEATAAQHFSLAVQAFHAGQWDAARAEFTVCYQLSKKPDLLHNLSMTAERQGTKEALADAITYEQQFLSLASLQPAERTEAANRVSQLQAKLRAVDEPPRRANRRVLLGALGLSLGGAMLIASLGTGGYALALKSDLEGRPITQVEFDEGLSRGRTLQSATIALAVVGGTIAVGSITLLALSRKRPR